MISSLGTHINDFLGFFGVKGAGIGLAVDSLTGNQIGVLQNMQDMFMETAFGRGTGPIQRRMMSMMGMMGGMSPFLGMASPMAMYPHMAAFTGGYAGMGSLAAMPLGGMSMMGLAGNPAAYMMGMQSCMAGRFGAMGMGLGGGAFMPFMMGGFASMLGIQGPGGAGAGPWDNSGMTGGRAWGSWNPLAMPGRINNTNPAYESAHQMQVASVLADPSLTVEDKVTLMIMLIMKKMDKDIERQAQYINSIQQQQSSRNPSGGGKGGKGGGVFGGATGNTGGNSPSIDVETMKLKRMVDKRSQMFDMLRQIIDKYNQTAKGIIDSIGR